MLINAHAFFYNIINLLGSKLTGHDDFMYDMLIFAEFVIDGINDQTWA